MPGHWSLLLTIGEFRPFEGRGSLNFLFGHQNGHNPSKLGK